MAIPADIRQAIKLRAAAEWPGDYEMQAHTIDQQSEAYLKMAHYVSSLDMKNEIFSNSYSKAHEDWPDDFEMQVYTFENQSEAAFAFFNYENSMLPSDILEQIKIAAYAEWPGDYEMMLHTLNNQVDAWIRINANE